MTAPLVDTHSREIEHLRVSINEECNFECVYCDKEGHVARPGNSRSKLSPDEAAGIARLFQEVGGVSRVKITGGEPLVHPEITEVVKAVAEVHGIEDISLTTNGSLLAGLAGKLKAAGLDRVNVSLVSLSRATFKHVTGADALDAVLSGLKEAKQAGLSPVKVNYVLLAGINDHELGDVVDYCAGNDFTLQLIELHEVEAVHGERHAFFERHHLDASVAVEGIGKTVARVETRPLQGRKVIHYDDGGAIELVKMSPVFCEACTKIRVGADGRIKPCLMKPSSEIDLLSMLEKGATPGQLRDAMEKAVSERHPYMAHEVE